MFPKEAKQHFWLNSKLQSLGADGNEAAAAGQIPESRPPASGFALRLRPAPRNLKLMSLNVDGVIVAGVATEKRCRG
jgi:hypothetical protein